MSGRNTSFSYSFVVLPRAKRNAITAVWDFCRAVDDTVDELVPCGAGHPAPAAEREQARQKLEEWRRDLERCYVGGSPKSAEARALQPFVAAFRLPRDAFEAVIDGVAMDLERCRYERFDDLLEYCRLVASAVGLICIEIFGYRDPRTRDYAVDLGIALQLTNIIRDVGVDLARGRIYLPLEDLARAGCSEADLRQERVTRPVRALLAFECERARGYYQKADAELPRIDRRRMVAARIMGAIYFDILRRIERGGYDVFRGVVRAPRSRRAVIAAGSWIRTWAGL